MLFCKASAAFLLKGLVCRTATQPATFQHPAGIAGKARQGLQTHFIGFMQAIQYMSVSTTNVTYRVPHHRHCLVACTRKNVGFVASDWKLKDTVFTPGLMAISCTIGENHSTSLYSDTDGGPPPQQGYRGCLLAPRLSPSAEGEKFSFQHIGEAGYLCGTCDPLPKGMVS